VTESAEKPVDLQHWLIQREQTRKDYRGRIIAGNDMATGEILFSARGLAWRVQAEGRTRDVVRAFEAIRGDGGALTFNFAPDPRCTWHECTARATTERTQLGGAVAPLCSTHNAEGDRLGYWLPQ
jgi:hypothetical protein